MPFQSKDISCLTYDGNRHAVWSYRTADSADDVLAPGYFDNAGDMLRVDDVIRVRSDARTRSAFKYLLVTALQGKRVTVQVADFSLFAATRHTQALAA